MKTYLLLGIGFVFFCLPVFSQHLSVSGSLCAGGSVSVSIISDSHCSSVRVLNRSYWSFEPQPDNITYHSTTSGGITYYNSVSVTYNSTGGKMIDVNNWNCSGPAGDGNPSIGFGIGASLTPTVQLTGPSTICPADVVTYTATASNAGSVPTFTWSVNGQFVSYGTTSGNISTFSPAPYSIGNGQGVAVSLLRDTNPGCYTRNNDSGSIIVSVPSAASTVTINGPTSKCNNDVATFNVVSTTNGGTSPAFSWYINGNQVDNGEGGVSVTNGGRHLEVSNWNYGNNTTVYCMMGTNSSCYPGSTSNTVTVAITSPQTLSGGITRSASPHGGSTFCEGESVTFTGSSNLAANYSWKLYGSTVGSGTTFTTSSIDPDYDGSSNSVQLVITTAAYCVINPVVTLTYPLTNITINRNPEPPGISNQTIQYNTGALLTATGGSNLNTYNWYDADGTFLFQGENFFTSVLTQNTNYSVALINETTSCGSERTPVVVAVNRPPVVNAGADQTLTAPVGSAIFAGSATDADGAIASYVWSQLSGPALRFTGTNTSTLTINAPPGGIYTFRLTATDNNGSSGYDDVQLTIKYPVSYLNFVRDEMVIIENIITSPMVDVLTSDQKITNTTYIDGLGRALQNVGHQASPSKKDIVQPVLLDRFGRDSLQFLPYVSAQNNGNYKSNAISLAGSYTSSDHYDYYSNGSADKVQDDNIPYATTIYEPSSLNRILKQGFTGDHWKPDAINTYASNDRTVKHANEINPVSEVLMWSFTYATPDYPFGLVNAGTASNPLYYASKKLSKTKVKDEQGNEVIEYTDNNVRTVLKRVQAVTGNVTVNDSNYASTYYIYDEFSNLVCVIPPEATNRLYKEYFHSKATDATKEAFLKRWAFRYQYDGRKRMIQKQVPGADPVYIVYDMRDRVVMTQDGNQRASKKWFLTKYDALNRPVLTGIYKHASIETQTSMTALISTTDFSEAYNGVASTHGYTNTVWPTLSTTILTATYYDNYDFKTLVGENLNYVNSDLLDQPSVESTIVTGKITGFKVNILGTTKFLYSITYFDDKYRPLQTISQNHLYGTDRTTNKYDFSGKIVSTLGTHTDSSIDWKDVVGVTTGPRSVKKTASIGWGNAGVASVQSLPANTDGWIEWNASELANAKTIGLSPTNANADYTSIGYSFNQNDYAALGIFEGGLSRIKYRPYANGDILRIQRVAGIVSYYKNGALIYTSKVRSTSALLVDMSFNTESAAVQNFRASWIKKSNTVLRNFDYDHLGRLLRTWHSVNSAPRILLSQNEYNELGQLIDKKLFSTDNGKTFKQSEDYRYTVRGWLTKINESDVNINEAGDPRDLFGMELLYDNVDGGIR